MANETVILQKDLSHYLYTLFKTNHLVWGRRGGGGGCFSCDRGTEQPDQDAEQKQELNRRETLHPNLYTQDITPDQQAETS